MKRPARKSASTRAISSETVSMSWLTRRQVAALLHMSEEQVAAMEGHQLFPRAAPDRSRRYSPDEVAAALAGASADGVVTAQAFGLFKQGVAMPDVVIETRQPAARIRALRGEYDEMVGGLALAAKVVQGLRERLGADAVKSGDALLEAFGKELDARYKAGFSDGQADVQDFGEIVDQKTGERRRVTSRGSKPEG